MTNDSNHQFLAEENENNFFDFENMSDEQIQLLKEEAMDVQVKRLKTELQKVKIKQNEQGEDIQTLNSRVEKFEKSTINYDEQLTLQKAKKKKVEELWSSGAFEGTYSDTKRKAHAHIWSVLYDKFRVNSFRDIQKDDFEEALKFIENFKPQNFIEDYRTKIVSFY